jgi:hypothetical protein
MSDRANESAGKFPRACFAKAHGGRADRDNCSFRETIANDARSRDAAELGRPDIRAMADYQAQMAMQQGMLQRKTQDLNNLVIQLNPQPAAQITVQTRLIDVPADKAGDFLHGIIADKIFLNSDAAAKFLKQVMGINGANLLTAPRITAFNGQATQVSVGDAAAASIDIESTCTASADRKEVNVEVSMNSSQPRTNSKIVDRWTISRTTVVIPDGQTCVFMQPVHSAYEVQADGSEKKVDPPAGDHIVWVMIQPTLITRAAANQIAPGS